jgi:catechol 2,3-dioxygenase-like lactoylglutathione lyase family enzyme
VHFRAFGVEVDAVKIAGPDHTNWRVRNYRTSLAFYREVFGFEPFGVEEFEREESPLVSLRVTGGFILHLVPDGEFEGGEGHGYDHLAFTVEGTSLDEVIEHLEGKGVEIERRFESIVGAKGRGPAVYVRDPDGYRIEIKVYPEA